MSSPERVRVVQVLSVENGYLITVPASGLNWCFRTLPEALEQVGRIFEPSAVLFTNYDSAVPS